jgi:hypothetical protein
VRRLVLRSEKWFREQDTLGKLAIISSAVFAAIVALFVAAMMG